MKATLLPLLLLLALVASTALAGNTDSANGATFYHLHEQSFAGEHAMTLSCRDAAFSSSMLPTDRLAMLCTVTQRRGTPYFLPFAIDYRIDNSRHTLGSDGYRTLSGQPGQLTPHNSVELLIFLPHAERGIPFTLQFGRDSIEVLLQPLPTLTASH